MNSYELRPLPDFLTSGYINWKSSVYSTKKNLHEKLYREGQKPKFMVISCCDSRINPNTIFNTDIGQLFVYRNIANIVPDFGATIFEDGIFSALEYATISLKIENIIVLGHSNCGGVKHALNKCISSNNSTDLVYVNKWTDLILGDYKKIPNNIDINEQQIFLEKENIKSSIKNIIKFLTLKKEFKIEKLSIHGLWFDINRGSLLQLDKIDGDFIKIVHE